MAKTSTDYWDPRFLNLSPMYFPIQEQASRLAHNSQNWPSLEDYQALLDQLSPPPRSANDYRIRFVAQAGRPHRWQEEYEPRIFLTGEVQTRLHNWHDFFQVLVWATFPHTKAVLNARHYHAIQRRKIRALDDKKRTPLENALTQFDECGAIVVSCDQHLLHLIRNFSWKELFWDHRAALPNRFQCYVFGHAVYEKALKPYVGLTAHAILHEVESEFFQWPVEQQCKHLDTLAAKDFAGDRYSSPQQFHPFPLLGMPNWYDNQQESYYDNQAYFRAGRRVISHPKESFVEQVDEQR